MGTEPVRAKSVDWSSPETLDYGALSRSPEARKALATELRRVAETPSGRVNAQGEALPARAGVDAGDHNGLVQTALNVLQGERVLNEDSRGGRFTRKAIADFQRQYRDAGGVDSVGGRGTYLAMADALERTQSEQPEPQNIVRRVEPERPSARVGVRIGGPTVSAAVDPSERVSPTTALRVSDDPARATAQPPKEDTPNEASLAIAKADDRINAMLAAIRRGEEAGRLPDGDFRRTTQGQAGDAAREQLDAIMQLRDTNPAAYEHAVDRLGKELGGEPGGERPDPAFLGTLLSSGRLTGEQTEVVANATWSRLDAAGQKEVARHVASALEAEGLSPTARTFPSVAPYLGEGRVEPVRPEHVAGVMKSAVDSERALIKRERADRLASATFGDELLPLSAAGAVSLASGFRALAGKLPSMFGRAGADASRASSTVANAFQRLPPPRMAGAFAPGSRSLTGEAAAVPRFLNGTNPLPAEKAELLSAAARQVRQMFAENHPEAQKWFLKLVELKEQYRAAGYRVH